MVTILNSEVASTFSVNILTYEEKQYLGVVHMSSLYVKPISYPSQGIQLLLALIFMLISATVVARFLAFPNRRTGLLCLLVFIGAIQPPLAYMKEHAVHTLAATSHYFYFWGVSCLVSTFALAREVAGRRAIILKSSAVVILLAFNVVFPRYVTRPPLLPFEWERYASAIQTSSDDVIVPINPDWRAVIPGRAKPLQ